jgi:hypothetical protein
MSIDDRCGVNFSQLLDLFWDQAVDRIIEPPPRGSPVRPDEQILDGRSMARYVENRKPSFDLIRHSHQPQSRKLE